MSISLFKLPYYKDMIHVSMDCYLEGKTSSCHGTELEDFAPIWSKLTSGKFPGHVMKLKKRIRDEEYSMYPIVFIDSEYWAAENGAKAHGSTWVHIVPAQRQNLSNCKSYQHRYIDRETGVVILEKTKLHGDCVEPDYKYWFYEKDTRQTLPQEILKETFSENGPGVYLTVKKFVDLPKTPLGCEPQKIDMDEYEHQYPIFSGYLEGENIRSLVKQHTFSDSRSVGCLLIEWQDSWNFVIHDEFGQKMFKVSTEEALAFIEQNHSLKKPVSVGKIFTIQKNGKQVRWKVVNHPYFDNQFALVRDYTGLHGSMRSGYSPDDDAHFCGKTSLETAYYDAYLMS